MRHDLEHGATAAALRTQLLDVHMHVVPKADVQSARTHSVSVMKHTRLIRGQLPSDATIRAHLVIPSR